MFFVMDKFAQYNTLLIIQFIQQASTGMFAYGCTNEVYEYYVKKNIWAFFAMGLVNVLFFLAGTGLGMYFYLYSSSGIYQFYGLSYAIYVITTTLPLIISIIAAAYYIDVKFFKKPQLLKAETQTQKV
ncbi:UNKNOWN [Stylonychia lemnae]|uniref:Uncharacterized protein n=1 Tax=Stylonychia lemnae TaxID=5949 RepID=A0A078B165_STYLE|nr:UNKNOWN [Stylonychia lemnae]|eukprot:CDW88299.1 UNKNOWN [Stylonychia lemnae]